MAYYYKRQKQDGGWIWFFGFKDVDGKDKRVSAYTHVKSVAVQKATKAEARVSKGLPGIPPPTEGATAKTFMEDWLDSLTNRNKEDCKGRARKHVLPRFGDMAIKDITLAETMKWIDAQRKAGKLTDATIRFNLNLLSRFFGWAIERGHADTNPVRLIPQGKRPQCTPKGDQPWLEDDELTRQLFEALPEPINLMFFLCNRSGLRLGEVCGLRISDVAELDKSIRVRFSYCGPLKESKAGQNKVKFIPASFDVPAVLGPWIKTREASGAKGDAFLFPCDTNDAGHYRKEHVEKIWERTRAPLGVELTFYAATRHSFVSRALSRGASLDEVSASVGHSNPAVTRRYYDHFLRREFSPAVREGMGLAKHAGEPGQIIPLSGVLGSRTAEVKKA